MARLKLVSTFRSAAAGSRRKRGTLRVLAYKDSFTRRGAQCFSLTVILQHGRLEDSGEEKNPRGLAAPCPPAQSSTRQTGFAEEAAKRGPAHSKMTSPALLARPSSHTVHFGRRPRSRAADAVNPGGDVTSFDLK